MTKSITNSSSSNATAWELADDAVIAEARYADPFDRVLAAFDEAGAGDLPSDDQLESLGVDRVTLARELRKGLNAKLFTRALTAGLNIDGFNNRPHESDSDLSLNTLLEHLVDHESLSRQLPHAGSRARFARYASV